MPKVRIGKTDPFEKTQILLKANIRKRMEVEGIDTEDLASVLGITAKTLREKLKDPSGFKMKELLIIFKVLKFTESEILESCKAA